MSYQRIQNFPENGIYEFPELRALSTVWLERKSVLEQDGAYKAFIQKMQREWAIETGIIERLYTWDRGVTEMLIEQGIEASLIAHRAGVSQNDAHQIQLMIKDHLDIVDGLFEYIKDEKPLTEYFIRGLQAQFTANQDHTEGWTESGAKVHISLIKGDYKTLPNNPRRPDGEAHFYCPPELTKEEMEQLIQMYRLAESKYSPEIKSAWLHHRFTQIHPFQDGNGRVARALASLVFLQAGLFPLVVRDSDRKEYIHALEAADQGNLGELIAFFARRQRDAILKALGLEQQVQQGRHADQIIDAALTLLRNKYDQRNVEISAVYDCADKLFMKVKTEFESLIKKLNPQLMALTPSGAVTQYSARTNRAQRSSKETGYFQRQIVAIANKNEFNYFVNFDAYRSWLRVTLSTEQDFEYVISFHGYGPGRTGILVASAFSCLKVLQEDGGKEKINLQPAATELFQFNYLEAHESTFQRFSEWLESSIAIALAQWNRSLSS
jgi:Fic family protein